MLPHKPAFMLAVLTALLTTAPSTALAWGAAGHAIVATIAQSLLHPAVRSHLCTILPDFTQYSSSFPREGAPHTHCHLAILASWPDTAKWRMPWSGKLHYVNPIDDDPPALCTYGERGWTSQENVLTSMVNYTRQLKETRGADRDVALRFVTHLVGDAHQPLHLTGRARGGNDVFVRFEGRSARLHSVWDSQIINVQMRSLANYTTRLPSPAIESALQGRAWDSYTRWILTEGLGLTLGRQKPSPIQRGWWEDEWQTWSHCGDDANVSGNTPTDRVDDVDLPVCPMTWTKPMHPLVCQYAFASPVPHPAKLEREDEMSAARRRRRRRRPSQPFPRPPSPPGGGGGGGGDGRDELPELAVPEYLGRIDADKVVQKQLAMGGVRLAALLNTLLLDEALAVQQAENQSAARSLQGQGFAFWQRLRRVARTRLTLWGF